MKFWVGVTDKNWFEFLRAQTPDEVNFWQPSAGRRAATLEAGAPFLFKLHAPNNFIVGGGFFVRYSALPARLAWDAFGVKNGVHDYEMLRQRVEQYRGRPIIGDPEIGCNVLNRPFFWPEHLWIPVPATWKANIVQGKSYSTSDADGLALWESIEERIHWAELQEEPDRSQFGDAYLTHARLGQGAFRVLITDAYRRRCAITGERTLPVLEAAHIQPYSRSGPHRVSNGLLLRSDLHTLFDRGYITIDEDLRVLVSPRIREEFENGREYYRHDGQLLSNTPQAAIDRPSKAFLHWHNEKVFIS
jgi:putative restriction endonuclease